MKNPILGLQAKSSSNVELKKRRRPRSSTSIACPSQRSGMSIDCS